MTLSSCSDRTLGLLVFLIAAIIFFHTIFYDLVWDDNMILEHTRNVLSFKGPVGLMFEQIQLGTWADERTGYYRPVILVSFWINSLLMNSRPFVFHLTNVIINALNVLLVFYLARFFSLSSLAAFLSAIFFAVHPIQVEAVSFVSGRSDLLSSMFMFLALAVYQYSIGLGRKFDKKLIYLCIPLLVLSGLAKETCYIGSVLLLLWGLTAPRFIDKVEPLSGKALRRLVFISLASLISIIGIRLLAVSGAAVVQKISNLNLKQSLYFIPGALSTYSHNILFPFDLSACYSYGQIVFSKLSVLLSFCLLVLILFIFPKKGRRLGWFGILWFFIFLAPSLLAGLASQQKLVIADRYLYLPMFGLAIIFGMMSETLLHKKRGNYSVRSVLVVYVVLLTILSFQQSAIWKNEISLFTSMRNTSPSMPFVYKNLGASLAKEGRYRQAISVYQEGIRIAPMDAELFFNMGMDYENLQEFEKALWAYREALRLRPNLINAKVRIAILESLIAQGK